MPVLLLNSLGLLAAYFPLGIVGAWRWSVWLTKRIAALWYRPTATIPGYQPTLTVVTPVYNEDPQLFRKALESWQQNQPEEIIAVIDYTDDRCIAIFKEFAQTFPRARLIVTERPGKRPALAQGAAAATSEIIALVDSDTTWDGDIRQQMLAPFADQRVGGVATRQDIMQTATLAQRLFNIHLDLRYFDEMAFLAAVSNTLTCLSGRTAVYRRAALLPVLDDMVNETFAGQPCISGEDKCLTRLVQASGWHMRYQRPVRVLTTGATSLRVFYQQQLRWSRNSWRSDLKSIFSRWIWRDSKVLAFHTIDRFVQPFTLLLGPVYLILSIYWHHWIAVGVLLVWWHISRGIKLYSHLRQRPSDLLIMPVYVVNTYLIALLKIYALFTIRQQGWITRWHTSRLRHIALFKKVPAYAGTATVIILLSGSVSGYKQVIADQIPATEQYIITEPADQLAARRQTVLDHLAGSQMGSLAVRKEYTLSAISQRYNVTLASVVNANRQTIPNPNVIDIGQRVDIPTAALREPPQKEDLLSARAPATVSYDPAERTITVSGTGSTVQLADIARRLPLPGLLAEVSPRQWILRANLFITEGVTLVIDGEEVAWLKLKSEDNEFAWLRAYNGNILIQDTKITSWDEQAQTPDTEHKNHGRSYILAKYNSRLDVLRSDISYLGYGVNDPYGAEHSLGGGVYGLSWRIDKNSVGHYLVTGLVLDNKIHHNYYGLYTYGAIGMVIRGNDVYENIQYGIDPHDDSSYLLIENNVAHHNGNHGIIISKRCAYNIIRRNLSFGNRLHGIMLDRQSNHNLVEGNITYGQVDGIALYDSHENVVRDNEIYDNQSGIRANQNSSGNVFEANKINNNKQGLYLYDGARSNLILNNQISGSDIGVYFKRAHDNIVAGSLSSGRNIRAAKNTEGTGNQIEVTK